MMTQAQLDELKHALDRRHAELRREIQAELLRADASRYADLAGQVHDRGDEAMADLLMDVDLASVNRHVQEVREIEAAWQRMDAGHYGKCIDCGAQIGPERLAVQPAAMRCIVCQARHEEALTTPRM